MPMTEPIPSPSRENKPKYNESDRTDAGQFANKILRGELAAVDAYEQVIQKFKEHGDAPISVLRRICADHADSCSQLKQVVHEEHVKASEVPGMWGGFVKGFIGVAGFLGENGAIRALKTGEEHGLEQYEEALNLDLSPWEKKMIQNVLVPKQKEHIAQLETILNKH
jgi:Domain of unknown function (DUF2383)